MSIHIGYTKYGPISAEIPHAQAATPRQDLPVDGYYPSKEAWGDPVEVANRMAGLTREPAFQERVKEYIRVAETLISSDTQKRGFNSPQTREEILAIRFVHMARIHDYIHHDMPILKTHSEVLWKFCRGKWWGRPTPRMMMGYFADFELQANSVTPQRVDNAVHSPSPTSEHLSRRLPLTEKARLIYEKLLSLKEYEAMTLPVIQDWLFSEHDINLDDGTWKDIRKELEPYGLANRPKVGYYICKK